MPLDHPLEAAEAIRYSAGNQLYDGLHFPGASDRLVVVLPDWRGCLTDYALRRGQDLADVTGASVCVTDGFGANQKPAGYAGDAETWIAQALSNPVALRDRLVSQIDSLRAHFGVKPERVSVVGYCLGGALAFEAGRSALDLNAVVSVHGIPSTRVPVTKPQGRTAFLAVHGADDPIIGLDHVRAFEAEMTSAVVDWQTCTIGGARHGFTSEEADPQGSHQRYDPKAAARALAFTKAFLNSTGQNA